jgi:hypothetical protein
MSLYNFLNIKPHCVVYRRIFWKSIFGYDRRQATIIRRFLEDAQNRKIDSFPSQQKKFAAADMNNYVTRTVHY